MSMSFRFIASWTTLSFKNNIADRFWINKLAFSGRPMVSYGIALQHYSFIEKKGKKEIWTTKFELKSKLEDEMIAGRREHPAGPTKCEEPTHRFPQVIISSLCTQISSFCGKLFSVVFETFHNSFSAFLGWRKEMEGSTGDDHTAKIATVLKTRSVYLIKLWSDLKCD